MDTSDANIDHVVSTWNIRNYDVKPVKSDVSSREASVGQGR